MASAEGRAAYAAKHCFAQDLRMPQNSSECSDHPLRASKKLGSDRSPSNSVDDLIHANSGYMPSNPNSDRLPDTKWWLHVKTNLGGEANYTCQHLHSWESELGAFYLGFLDDSVKTGVDQSINSLSDIGSANINVKQPRSLSPKRMKSNNDTEMPKIEAAINSGLNLTPKKKDQGECWFSDDHFVDSDISSFLASGQCKRTSSDLESCWMRTEKTGPWWRNAGKDELASLVAQKSLEHIENCDLPQPQIKHFRQRPSVYPKSVDHDKTLPSSLNQKTEVGSSNADDYTSGTPTSGSSFQDSDRLFSQSKDSDSSNKDHQINYDNKSIAELLEALCHSQTRAREAEKAAQQAYNEKEHILSLFFRQASQLFAYRQWFNMLQLENFCLQLRNKNQPLLNLLPAAAPWVPCGRKQPKRSHRRGGKRKNCNRRCGVRRLSVAFAVGLGLAGAGLLLGLTMGWMFPLL